MPDHPTELFCGQAWVKSVADRAHAHDAVPRFDMFLRVPRERGHSVASLNVKRVQRCRDEASAAMQFRVIDPSDCSVIPGAHHFSVGMPLCSVVQKPIQR